METEEKRLKIEKIEGYDKEIDAKSSDAFNNGILGIIAVVYGCKCYFDSTPNYQLLNGIIAAIATLVGGIGLFKAIRRLTEIQALKILKSEVQAEFGEEKPSLKNIKK